MRDIQFTLTAHKQFKEWEKRDKKIYGHIALLLQGIEMEPFKGIGKPEPLKHQLKGYWSRRITKEHRLVYRVTTTAIIVVSCKYHY